MSWFSRLWRSKVSQAGPAVSSYFVGRPVWSARNFGSFAKEAYTVNAVAHRCIKLIAQNAATPRWILYKGTTEIEDHPLLTLLNRPNPVNSGEQLFEALYAYLVIAGNSYVEAVTAGTKVKELWTLRPDRMAVVPGPFGMPSSYVYSVNGQKTAWQVDPITGSSPILHLREFNPTDDWYGLSPTEPAAFGIDRYNASSAYNKALLDNGARPSGALVFEPIKGGPDEPPQSAPQSVIDAAEKHLNEMHVGANNAGRPLVLGGNVRWEEMGISPKDQDFTENAEAAARDICTAFGVPHILVVPGESTYNNIREANLMLWEETIIPLVSRVIGSLNTWLVPQFEATLRLEMDLDEVVALEPRRESRRTSVLSLYDAGIITRNEARDSLQYEEWPDGEVGKIEAPVLTALIDGIQMVGPGPVERYLVNTGLYSNGETIDAAVSKLPEPADLNPSPDLNADPNADPLSGE